MGYSQAFQTANQIGTNFYNEGLIREQKQKQANEQNTIETILEQASKSGDPQIFQDSIGKILSKVSPERQGAAIKYLESTYERIQEKQKQSKTESEGRLAAKQAGYTYGAPPQVAAQQIKNQQPQKPEGGLTGQPVPSQISKIIPGILENNKSANADNLAVAFDTAGIPRAFSNSYIENRRRQDESKKPGDQFSSDREKAVSNYVNDAITQGEDAENLRYTIDTVRKAVQGDVAGPGVEALAKNNPYSQILLGLTPDESLLLSANKKLLEGTKSIFGSKPTEREIFLLLNSMLPSIGKTKEANIVGLDFIEKINDLKIKHSDVVNELTDGGTKYVADLERKVASAMKPYGEKLRDELKEADKKINKKESKESKSAPNISGKIKVKAPDGTIGYMTQQQIDEAKKNNVIFIPEK